MKGGKICFSLFAVILISGFFLFQITSTGHCEVFRYGEEYRWNTLEPITARSPVEWGIMSLLYPRLFWYDESVIGGYHPGLKPRLVENNVHGEQNKGQFSMRFRTDSPLDPGDFRYTLDLMTHEKTYYHQPRYCYAWDQGGEDRIYYEPNLDPRAFSIDMRGGSPLAMANFHLVRRKSLGDCIERGTEQRDVINNAATGPFRIEEVGDNRMILSARNQVRERGIDRVELIIAAFSNLRDRLKQSQRNPNSLDMIPEMNIREISYYEEGERAINYRTCPIPSNNFWSIGFNYKVRGADDPRNLFHNRIFRRYLGLAVKAGDLFSNTLSMNEGFGELICGPLYQRPGLERLYGDIEFCCSRDWWPQGADLATLRTRLINENVLRGKKEGGPLRFGGRPVTLTFLHPIFGRMGTELENIVARMVEVFPNYGIRLRPVPARNLKEWEEKLEKRDFDLVIKEDYYDYSFDITPYFHPAHPLNICGLPRDSSSLIQRLIREVQSPPAGEDRLSCLKALNCALSDEVVAIFLWNLKYCTVFRKVVDYGGKEAGPNDIDLFQGIEDWTIGRP